MVCNSYLALGPQKLKDLPWWEHGALGAKALVQAFWALSFLHKILIFLSCQLLGVFFLTSMYPLKNLSNDDEQILGEGQVAGEGSQSQLL